MSDQALSYNLKAVVLETGLNPETIRAWERRYGLPAPQRTPGGHRLYSWRDIQMLKWLVARQGEGLSISRSVEMWRSLENKGQDPLGLSMPGLAVTSTASNTLDDLRNSWLKACLDFDEPSAERSVSRAFAIAAPEIAAVEVLQKGISEIGHLWYAGMASVQQEHFASSLAIRKLHALIAATSTPTRRGRILAACPPDEGHDFGLLLATFLLRWHGWGVIYLGANVPAFWFEATLRAASPILVISVAQMLPTAATLHSMAAISNSQNVPLAYGGRIFNLHPDLKEHIPGNFLGGDILSVPQAVERITSQPRPLPAVLPLPLDYRQALTRFITARPAMEAEVVAKLKQEGIIPPNMEETNHFFADHVSAALSLGEIDVLDDSLRWIEGLVLNRSMSPHTLQRYLEIYNQAIQNHAGSQAELLTNWLSQYLAQNQAR